MSKFAKLFDIEDTQLLVQITTNDDSYPSVLWTTSIDGLRIQVGPSFGPRDDGSYDEDVAWKSAERLFKSINKSKAKELYQEVVKMMNDFGVDDEA